MTELSFPQTSIPSDRVGAYAAPLLTLSTAVTTQLAGAALRHWWSNSDHFERALGGIPVARHQILSRNTSASRDIPFLLLEPEAPKVGDAALAVASDGSALALRYEYLDGRQMHDCFRVVPRVFRLASVARPTDGRVPFRMKMRKGGKTTTLLSLERESDPQGWVNITSGWMTQLDGMTFEFRQEIIADLLAEASAWCELHGEEPFLVDADPGMAPRGHLPAREGGEGFIPYFPELSGRAYAHPAFLPYRRYDRALEEPLSDFLLMLAEWSLLRAPDRIEEVEITVKTGQLCQKSGKASDPTLVVHAMVATTRNEPEVAEALKIGILAALRSDLAPIPWNMLVGQTEEQFRNRQSRLETIRFPTRFATRKRMVEKSAHAKMALLRNMQRFETP